MIRPDAGRLPENILHFARTLRAAGIPVGTHQVIDALDAVRQAGIERREDFYWALRAVLVQRQTEFSLFEQAFHLYFRNPRLLERLISQLLPLVPREPGQGPVPAGLRRLHEALDGDGPEQASGTIAIAERAGTSSEREILRNKDFEQMTLSEQQEARQLLRAELPLLSPQPTRRFRADYRGERYDLQRTLRQMQRGPVDVLPLLRKRRRVRPPDLVLICDISGSMSSYSRMFLQFAHALTGREPVVHTFVFGTRLTPVTQYLRRSDADEAIEGVAAVVRDWDGGTRIAACLHDFNRKWGRRVSARNAVTILLSDGLERDAGADLEFEMRRLRRSCRRLIWMNPMLRYSGFEPKASGIRKMLPHVDRMVSAHNLASITSVMEALQAVGSEQVKGSQPSIGVRVKGQSKLQKQATVYSVPLL